VRDALADVLLPSDVPDDVAFRVGTVTADATPGPVEVSVGGADGMSAAYLASYTPVETDTVLILQTKADLIILGAITSGG
jgi:hypothetical protein